MRPGAHRDREHEAYGGRGESADQDHREAAAGLIGMKTRPLGTTDLQFRLGMSYLAAVGVGIFSFSIWGFLIQLGDSISWGTWYYPAGFTVFVALCVFLSPE